MIERFEVNRSTVTLAPCRRREREDQRGAPPLVRKRTLRNEAVAEEVMNETYLAVWQNAARYEARSAPMTWMLLGWVRLRWPTSAAEAAASAVAVNFGGDLAEALLLHEERSRQKLVSYLRTRFSYYRSEGRWADRPFWSRRHNLQKPFLISGSKGAFG